VAFPMSSLLPFEPGARAHGEPLGQHGGR
jgi:hypothetical protein